MDRKRLRKRLEELRDRDLPQLVDGVTSTTWRLLVASEIRDVINALIKVDDALGRH